MTTGPVTSEALARPPRSMLRFWGWMACLLAATLIGLAICGLMRPAPLTLATHGLPAMLESGLRGLPVWYHLWVAGTVALIAHLQFDALWKRLAATYTGIFALYALIGLAVLVGPTIDFLQHCSSTLEGTCSAVKNTLMLGLARRLAVAWTLQVIAPLAVFTIAAYAWLALGLRIAERLKSWLNKRARL